jgi:hypothetical protein
MSIQPTAHWVIDTPPILTPTALDDLRGGAQVKNPTDPGESKTAPSTSGSTEQSSSNSVKHISRKMLVAVGSIISAIAIGAGTPLVVKVVDRYFLTPDHQVSTSSPAPPSQGTQPAPPSQGPEPAPPPQETETAEAPPDARQATSRIPAMATATTRCRLARRPPKTHVWLATTGIPQRGVSPVLLTHRRPIPVKILVKRSIGITPPLASAFLCLKMSARRDGV